jgi:4-hydroxybenzoate polyprenyltransferase
MRAWLVLGRVSNLPTVWSNCLAGWFLGGGGPAGPFLVVCLGATLLYAGGMFLNDAFDEPFDRQHRRNRPIPAGAVASGSVWHAGFGSLLVGFVVFSLLGMVPAVLAVLLIGCILIYDAIHKIFAFSPVLIATCRCLLVLLAAAPADSGLTGLSIWSGLVLALYVLGFSVLARREGFAAEVPYWPCGLLAGPLVLALVVNRGEWQLRGLALGGLLLVWTLLSLRHDYWVRHRHVGRAVAGLLAGIVLVDLLAVGVGNWATNLAFAGLFGLARLLQRFVPAT